MKTKFAKMVTSKIGKSITILSASCMGAGAVLYFLGFHTIGTSLTIPILLYIFIVLLIFGLTGFRNIYSFPMRGLENIVIKIILLFTTIFAALFASSLLLTFYDQIFSLPSFFFYENLTRKVGNENWSNLTLAVAGLILFINWLMRYRKPIID